MFIYFFSVVLSLGIMLPGAAHLRKDGEVRVGLFLCLLAAALVPVLNVAATILMIILVCVDLAESNIGRVVFKIKK